MSFRENNRLQKYFGIKQTLIHPEENPRANRNTSGVQRARQQYVTASRRRRVRGPAPAEPVCSSTSYFATLLAGAPPDSALESKKRVYLHSQIVLLILRYSLLQCLGYRRPKRVRPVLKYVL